MRILEYAGLDTRGVQAQYKKLVAAIRRSANIKKLAGHSRYHCARLDDSNRLLFIAR